MLSNAAFTHWCNPAETGIYAEVDAGGGTRLKVSVEKDFACLDSSDADNHGTFDHPHAGAVC